MGRGRRGRPRPNGKMWICLISRFAKEDEEMEQAKVANLFNLDMTIARGLFDGLSYPWEALSGIAAFIRKIGPTLDPAAYERHGVDVWIARSADVATSAYLNGPLIIDEGAQVRHCAFIRGSAVIGRNCVVGNSTELKNVVLFDSVQVPHYNYIGDSILGFRAHMGAGAITSNVKADKSPVVVRDGVEEIETGLKKFGAMLGDFAEVGCNAVLNPGTVIGRGTSVYPLSSVRGVIPAASIYKGGGEVVARREE